jgi:hypothetical protein
MVTYVWQRLGLSRIAYDIKKNFGDTSVFSKDYGHSKGFNVRGQSPKRPEPVPGRQFLSRNDFLLLLLYFFIEVCELLFQKDLLGDIVSNTGNSDIFSCGIFDNRS